MMFAYFKHHVNVIFVCFYYIPLQYGHYLSTCYVVLSRQFVIV